MKRLARKRREPDEGPGQPWLATFADLMNLLLCFFVMLFAMSDVNAEKFNQISASMANSFGILQGGGTAIIDGQLISSGVSQLNNLDEYYSNMGIDNVDGSLKGEDIETGSSTLEDDYQEALDMIQEKMEKVTTQMYDDISELTESYSLGGYVELAMDPEYQFVKLSLKGSVLFDSGKAEIKEQAKPILSKIGDVLAKFEDYTIEIEGHTDNVPIVNANYKDNNWLSSARALNAADYLIKVKKLNPAKLKYTGRGEHNPIASNDTEEGRAKNRRIEIKIYNEFSGK
ncbi:MAG: flagellar motor protein MotB [Clostridiales bacterium]|nr:flagellar motor protein MotB [Clostridiales bacterium]